MKRAWNDPRFAVGPKGVPVGTKIPQNTPQALPTGQTSPNVLNLPSLGRSENLVPSLNTTLSPEERAYEFSTQLAKNVLDKTLPMYTNLLDLDYALPQIEEFTGLPEQSRPELISFLNMLKKTSPGLSDTFDESLFKPSEFYAPGGAPEFTAGEFSRSKYLPDPAASGYASEFFGTQPITADVLNDPRFKALQAEMETATGKSSEQIADEMARRGVLYSGSTKEEFGDLNAENARKIATAMGGIAGPLISQSVLNEAIFEPRRKTDFSKDWKRFLFGADTASQREESDFLERLAGKETAFSTAEGVRKTRFGQDLYQDELGETARRTEFERAERDKETAEQTEAINRALRVTGIELGQEETAQASLKDWEERQADLIREYRQRGAGVGVAQDEQTLNYMATINNIINSAMTGQQVQPSVINALSSARTSQADVDLNKIKAGLARQTGANERLRLIGELFSDLR